jgi:asparagine synthase (glutamine-hydrolysing)
MCGVVGIHGPQEPSWIEMMNASILHRGPDDEGYYRDPQRQLSLAMRRLAIVDLAGGHQPMSTRDGRYTIVFNGEIYNAPVLREQLRGTGTEFSTDRSDTEIVLQLYAKHGREVLGYLNGMFAFAVFDREQETLFLARDRLGIKPLYYVDVGGRFAFASELKALLALPISLHESHVRARRTQHCQGGATPAARAFAYVQSAESARGDAQVVEADDQAPVSVQKRMGGAIAGRARGRRPAVVSIGRSSGLFAIRRA